MTKPLCVDLGQVFNMFIKQSKISDFQTGRVRVVILHLENKKGPLTAEKLV